MSVLETMDVAMRRYTCRMRIEPHIQSQLQELYVSEFHPSSTKLSILAGLYAKTRDSRCIGIPIEIDIDSITGSSPTQIYTAIQTAVDLALEELKTHLYEDPFLTWAKKVVKDRNEKRSEVEGNNV